MEEAKAMMTGDEAYEISFFKIDSMLWVAVADVTSGLGGQVLQVTTLLNSSITFLYAFCFAT